MVLLMVVWACLVASAAATPSEATAAWFLTNSADFSGSSTVTTKLAYTNAIGTVDASIFSMGSDGTLLFPQAGVVDCHASFRVIGSGSPSWVGIYSFVNGDGKTASLVPYTAGEYQQNHLYFNYKVAANDVLSFRAIPSHIQSMDNDPWSYMSCRWRSQGEGFVYYLANAADFTTPTTCAFTKLKYTTLEHSSSSAPFTFHSSGNISVLQTGSISFSASMDFISDNDPGYARVEFYHNGVRKYAALAPDDGGKWHNNLLTVHIDVTAGDTLEFYSRPCEVVNLSNNVWSWLTIAFQLGTVDRTKGALAYPTNNDALETSTSTSFENIKYANTQYTNSHVTFQTDGNITINHAGAVAFEATFDVKTSATFVTAKLFVDGVEVASSMTDNPGSTLWTQLHIAHHFTAIAGSTIEVKVRPSEITEMDNSVWSFATVSYSGAGILPCDDESPLQEADAPTLTATFPKIESNLYKLSFTYKKVFESISVTFGGSPSDDCNLLLSDYSATTYWSQTNEVHGPDCTWDAYFARNVQNMLGNCGFTADAGVFTNIVTVTTRQNRTLVGSNAASGRTQNYIQVKDIEFRVQVTIPTSIEVNSTATVFGNVTVLSALLNQFINASASDGTLPLLQYDVRVSSQYPYQLTYNGFTQGSAQGNTGQLTQNPQVAAHRNSGGGVAFTDSQLRWLFLFCFGFLFLVCLMLQVVETTPACQVDAADTPCVQTFQFYGQPITHNGTECTLDTVDYRLNFGVGCTANFTGENGGCNTPNPSTISVSLSFTSSNYCPTTDTFTPVPSVTSYKTSSRTDVETQYVVGSTVFGVLHVTIPSDAVTVTDVVINSIHTIGFGSATVLVYDDTSDPGLGVEVDTGAGVDADKSHFDLPLVNGGTVVLDNNNEAAQSITISVQGTLSFTPDTGAVRGAAPILQDWHRDATEASQRRRAVALSSTPLSQGVASESLVSISTPGVVSSGGTGSSSSGSAVTGSVALVAAVALVAVVAMVVAFRRGRQHGAVTVEHKRAGKASVQLVKSSSAVEIDVTAETDDIDSV